jgi:TatA/E family protein of Tat protein translocase
MMMAQLQLAMFSTPDIMLILVIALLLFGPKNLPKMARGIGKSMEEFRRAAREIETEIMKEPEPTTPPPPPPPSTETTPAAEHTPEGEHHYSETGEEYPGYETGPTTDTSSETPVVVSDNPVVLPADAAPAAAAAPAVAPVIAPAAPVAATVETPAALAPADEPAQAASVNPPVEKKTDAQTAA